LIDERILAAALIHDGFKNGSKETIEHPRALRLVSQTKPIKEAATEAGLRNHTDGTHRCSGYSRVAPTQRDSVRVLQNIAARRLIRKLSIALEFAMARAWKRRHPEFVASHTTIGVMVPARINGRNHRGRPEIRLLREEHAAAARVVEPLIASKGIQSNEYLEAEKARTIAWNKLRVALGLPCEFTG
jgi:hypothetical protein